jgi:hypothetical protein
LPAVEEFLDAAAADGSILAYRVGVLTREDLRELVYRCLQSLDIWPN